MASRLLTTGSAIQCPHGAPAILSTADAHVSAGARVLIESDTHTVAGCPYQEGDHSSPCVTIAWSAGARRVKVGGTAPLHEHSLGQCKNPAGAVQGTALVATTQPRVSAT